MDKFRKTLYPSDSLKINEAIRKLEDTISDFDKTSKINIISLLLIKTIKKESWQLKKTILMNLATVLDIKSKFSIMERIR